MMEGGGVRCEEVGQAHEEGRAGPTGPSCGRRRFQYRMSQTGAAAVK
jgi:hypothetical protein